MFGAVQILNVLILTLLCDQFNSVKVTELPPVWERAANSAYLLLDTFVHLEIPLMFGISFGF